MAIRKASARWQGTLREGSGTMFLGSGAYEGPYTYASRFEEAPGANPEELIGAAHAGCFSMALSARLAKAGFTNINIQTTASITLENGAITTSELNTVAEVPGLDTDTFIKLAQDAKENCPVSRALSAINITLHARLVS